MALSIRFETSTIPLLILGVNSLFNNDVSLMFAMESVCPILSCKYSAMAFFSFSSVRISSEFNFLVSSDICLSGLSFSFGFFLLLLI